MRNNQSISKKQRMYFQPGRDMLSDLPLKIIHTILALVPFKDAVRTSILSKQWRYAWASLPQIVFEDECASVFYTEKVRQFEERMENSITHVLALHKAPIDKFKLAVPFKRTCWNMGVWLLCLARNDIRELIIDTPYLKQELHSSIYSCKKLIKLELNNCQLDPPPTTFKTFLFLRSLCLQRVLLPSNEVESLVANCPLLEELTLSECGISEMKISAPNLKGLRLLYDEYVEISVCAPLLAELSVDFGDCDFPPDHPQQDSSVDSDLTPESVDSELTPDHSQKESSADSDLTPESVDSELTPDHSQQSSACNYNVVIGGFTNLEKLKGDFNFMKYLSRGIESCHRTLVFHQLKEIELLYLEFYDIDFVSFVARLIVDAPNLQKLKISSLTYVGKGDYQSEDPWEYFGDFGCAPNAKLEKLRLVHMTYIFGFNFEMAFIRFLLERSPILETMSFGELSYKEIWLLNDRLQECYRAFPNVKLMILA